LHQNIPENHLEPLTSRDVIEHMTTWSPTSHVL